MHYKSKLSRLEIIVILDIEVCRHGIKCSHLETYMKYDISSKIEKNCAKILKVATCKNMKACLLEKYETLIWKLFTVENEQE